MQQPKSIVAQTSTLTKWCAYLQQKSHLSTSPLSKELQAVLGPVTYQDTGQLKPKLETLLPSPIHKGEPPIPEEAWNMDDSCQGTPPWWRAVVYQPATETIWLENRELQAV